MKKIITSVFNFISSINLTILVLSAATVIFILQITREKLATLPSWKWLTIIPEFDFYHSRGSIILFALFCVNLVACSLKRLPRTISITEVHQGCLMMRFCLQCLILLHLLLKNPG